MDLLLELGDLDWAGRFERVLVWGYNIISLLRYFIIAFPIQYFGVSVIFSRTLYCFFLLWNTSFHNLLFAFAFHFLLRLRGFLLIAFIISWVIHLLCLYCDRILVQTHQPTVSNDLPVEVNGSLAAKLFYFLENWTLDLDWIWVTVMKHRLLLVLIHLVVAIRTELYCLALAEGIPDVPPTLFIVFKHLSIVGVRAADLRIFHQIFATIVVGLYLVRLLGFSITMRWYFIFRVLGCAPAWTLDLGSCFTQTFAFRLSFILFKARGIPQLALLAFHRIVH